MNPICILAPSFCNSSGSSGGIPNPLSGLFDIIKFFVDLFSGNGLADALKSTLDVVKSTPVANLGVRSFVDVYSSIYGFVLILLLFFLVVNFIRFIWNSGKEDNDGVAGMIGVFKTALLGAYLPAIVNAALFLSQLAVKGIDAGIPNTWQQGLTDHFSFANPFERFFGRIVAGLLNLELLPLELGVYILVPLCLISYLVTASRPDGSIGAPSRILWSFLATAILLQPVLMLWLGLGGYFVASRDIGGAGKASLVMILLVGSLFAWIVVFRKTNRRIKTYFANRVIRITGDVRSTQVNSVQQQIDAQQSINARINVANDGGKHGVRYARHAVVDSGAVLLAAKAASAIHPAAAIPIHATHAFLRGRRPERQPYLPPNPQP